MHPGRFRHALGRTPRSTGAAVLGVVVAGALLAGCTADGGDDGSTAPPDAAASATADTGQPVPGQTLPAQSQDPDMTQPADPTPQPTGTTGDGGEGDGDALTEQDSGAQLSLAVGEERPLQLGSAWSWAEPVVDGVAVTLTPVEFLVDPGYVEWLVTGAAPGTATLEVVGEPVCGDTTVCPPTTVTLDVEVTG